MNRSISELKIHARKALSGKYAMVIGATILLSIIMSMGSSLSMTLFGSDTLFSIVMGQLFNFILSLILSVFSAGLSYMILNIARGKEARYGDLVYLFHHHPDRVILVSLVLASIQYICTVPSLIYSYRLLELNTADIVLLLQQTALTAGMMLMGIAVSSILSLPFSLSYYLVIDDEKMEAREALTTSIKMMKGNYGRYIYLLFSFLGLLILGILSCYVGLLWIQPYMEMTMVEFYRDLIGELDEKKEPVPEATGALVPAGSVANDDYNAEA